MGNYIIGVIKGDTRSLDYSSCNACRLKGEQLSLITVVLGECKELGWKVGPRSYSEVVELHNRQRAWYVQKFANC